MFNSATHLPQLLTPEQYTTRQQYELEIERLFVPEWHFVCTTADLPRNGDFLTLEFCSRPVLIRNFDGEYRAFLNVCPHRFCRISGLPRGRSEVFRCQYHGWEFDCTGQTRRIPDAVNFRPLEKGQAELVALRTERMGQLVFVSFAENGPSLRESFASLWDELSSYVSNDWTQIMTLQTGPEGNWKCAVEVTLEGYHVGTAHSNSLGAFPQPTEADWTHQLTDPRVADMRARLPQEKRLRQLLERLCLLHLKKPYTSNYFSIRRYPGFGCITQDLFTIAQSVLPTGPDTHVNIYRLFMYTGARTPLQRYKAWSCGLFAKPILRSLWRRTFKEDAAIIRAAQAGLSSPVLPSGGVISRREECVFHFQRYVQEFCGISPAPGSLSSGEFAFDPAGCCGGDESEAATTRGSFHQP
jgi:choline monooxygenase